MIDPHIGKLKILDEVIPLDGASHTDVVNYSVEIPLRYAECFALLCDGRKVVNIRNIVVEDATACHSRTEKRFIGVDGDLVLLPT